MPTTEYPVSVRLTAAERGAVTDLANHEHRSTANMLRVLVLEALVNHQALPSMWKIGDRVMRFDGSAGTVERLEPAPFSGHTVWVKWDDPNVVDEFDGITDDDLAAEGDFE